MKITWVEADILAASGIPVGGKDVQSLYEQGVRAIVSLTEHSLESYRPELKALLAELDIDYFHCPIDDQYAPTKAQVSEVAQFVDRMKASQRAVYLHCHAGIGRTGTMLHAYYLVQGQSLDEARQFIKRRKSSSQFFMLSDVQQRFLQELSKDFVTPSTTKIMSTLTDSILESAYLQVVPDYEDEFEGAFKQASQIIASMQGYISHELHRCIETPNRYLLLVRWETLEDHTVGFRESAEYQKWKTLLHHFYHPMPIVEHFQQISLEID